MSSEDLNIRNKLNITFNDILNACRENLIKSKQIKSLKYIKTHLKYSPDPLNFQKALQGGKKFPLIVEYKPASPSHGYISTYNLKEALKSFEDGGASAISIITEEKFFNGKLNYLKQASYISSLPILRKDFILDEYQIYEARLYGASSVLLMSDVYPDICSGIETCRSLGMEPLVECKNLIEIYNALEADAKIIGINNRSFKDFSIDFLRTKFLSPLIPEDKILVAESGIRNPIDVQKMREYGADALLIGTSIMKSSDMAQTIFRMRSAAERTSKKIYRPPGNYMFSRRINNGL